ncbi:hypothetical protein ASE61_00565 [Bosea sp. Root670]|uniref:hypothetical protein n=1 Tax=Bosea sp. Root670 TaxID=1736583 RepID=UPI0007123ED7|nr:hypothetical protein [Bosea sp. Root670]KRE08143.1 hypothetical protein ASE61_00565 [Bosea sp. Root670]
MSGVDIAGLVSGWRKAMEGVSAGPWRHYRNKLRPQFGGIINEVQCRSKTPVVAWPGFEDSKRKEPKHAINAAWIARCSPSGISALLDALLAQVAELAEARREVGRKHDEANRYVNEMIAWRSAFQRVTPGGSEFTSPEAVRDWADMLKEQVFEANKKAVLSKRRAVEATRQRDEALAALKASEERGERLSQELASARCPQEPWLATPERITQKYLRRYPTSKATRSWAGCMVHISTEHGVWCINGQGYTRAGKFDAWVLPFEEARGHVAHCGPEKEAAFIKVVQPIGSGSQLADATNNPPSDPGTEQREAGRG